MERDSQAYKVLTHIFEKNNLFVSVPEIQGVIFGYLSATEEPCFESWIDAISDLILWNEVDIDLQTHLKNIFIAMHLELTQSVQHCTLIIPDLDASFTIQMTALLELARGCLYGIGLGHLSHEFFENPELEDAIKDLAQIAQIDLSQASKEDVQDNLDDCFHHVEMIIGLLYRAIRESMHEE